MFFLLPLKHNDLTSAILQHTKLYTDDMLRDWPPCLNLELYSSLKAALQIISKMQSHSVWRLDIFLFTTAFTVSLTITWISIFLPEGFCCVMHVWCIWRVVFKSREIGVMNTGYRRLHYKNRNMSKTHETAMLDGCLMCGTQFYMRCMAVWFGIGILVYTLCVTSTESMFIAKSAICWINCCEPWLHLYFNITCVMCYCIELKKRKELVSLSAKPVKKTNRW